MADAERKAFVEGMMREIEASAKVTEDGDVEVEISQEMVFRVLQDMERRGLCPPNSEPEETEDGS